MRINLATANFWRMGDEQIKVSFPCLALWRLEILCINMVRDCSYASEILLSFDGLLGFLETFLVGCNSAWLICKVKWILGQCLENEH